MTIYEGINDKRIRIHVSNVHFARKLKDNIMQYDPRTEQREIS